jgi:chromosome segregation ATPase
MTISRISALAAIPLLLIAACGDGQEPAADEADAAAAFSPFGDMDPAAAAAMAELQEIHQRLQPIHQEAMQDAAMSAQFSEIQATVEGAMRADEPELFERIEKLQAEVRTAQESGDAGRMQEIAMESQGIEMEVRAAEASIVSRPDVQAQIESFEQNLRERMIAIDSEAGDLLDRSQELQDELQAHQEQAMAPPAQP